MTVKELKEIVANIDEKYDNEQVLTDCKDYDEYCMGSSYTEVTGIEKYFSSFECLGVGYYIAFEQ